MRIGFDWIGLCVGDYDPPSVRRFGSVFLSCLVLSARGPGGRVGGEGGGRVSCCGCGAESEAFQQTLAGVLMPDALAGACSV